MPHLSLSLQVKDKSGLRPRATCQPWASTSKSSRGVRSIRGLNSSPLGNAEGIYCPHFADGESEAQEHQYDFANRGSQGSILESTVLFKHYAEETWPIFLATCLVCLMTLSTLVVPMLSRERQTQKSDFLVLKRVFAARHRLLQPSCSDLTPVQESSSCEAGFEDQSSAGDLDAATQGSQALFKGLQPGMGTELWKLPGEAGEISEHLFCKSCQERGMICR